MKLINLKKLISIHISTSIVACYNTFFLNVNSDKIEKRIRMLMQESYFYKKETLFNLVNTYYNYDTIQIFYVLDYLIHDINIVIYDKFVFIFGKNIQFIEAWILGCLILH